MNSAPCLAPDMIGTFLDGGLDPESRRGVVEHIAHCTACRNGFLAKLHAAPPRRSAIGRLAALFILAMVIAIVVQYDSTSSRGIAALVKAHNALPARAIEGRLSGNFAHKPRQPTLRGGKQPEQVNMLRLHAAAASIRSEEPDSHASGVAALVAGDYDRAISTLEAVTHRMPDDPLVLSDLSAAYHARAAFRDYAADHVSALDAAEAAWRLSQTPATAWNRAVAISALLPAEPALEAWDDVLALDDNSSWRSEAQQRKRSLETVTERDGWLRQKSRLTADSAGDAVDRFPAQAQAFLEDELLPRWAIAQLRGDGTATAVHDLASSIATRLAEQGERLPLDTLFAIDHACSSPSGCVDIARAHAEYAAGVRFLDAQQINDAAAAFEKAASALERLRSPHALLSRFRRGACMLHANEFTRAAATGSSVLTAIGDRPYRNLSARASWLLGLATLHQARPEESIAHYGDARALFIRGRDTTNLASAEFLLADAFEYAGDRVAAMRHRMAGLAAVRRNGDTKLLANALFDFATSAAERWPYASDLLLAESTRVAIRRRSFVIAALTSMWRSKLAVRRRDFPAATEHARMASHYSQQTTDPGQRALVQANANQFAAISQTPVNAAQKLTETIDFFAKSGNDAWLPQLLRQRALVQEQKGNHSAAESDFRAAIDAAERTLDHTAPASMRDGFAIDARANFDDLIRLLVNRGETRAALAVAERARLIGSGPHGQQDVLAVLGSLERSTAAAVFEIQSNALFVWLVTRDSVTFYRRELPQEALAGDMTSDSARAALYDVLLRDWIARVPRNSDLIVLPSQRLAAVPFGALIDRHSGRAVIDHHTVVIAGSLASLRSQRVTVSPSDDVLIVGDPSYRSLPHLPASRIEANEIARNYRHPVVLLGDDATAPNLVARMTGAEVFHFGGHAVLNDYAPEMSSIMLAADREKDTRLYVHELLQRRLPFKLVVLSACGTARGSAGNARGTLTIARAFLEGGTRAVVATHWPVSDAASALFSRSFHAALTEGQDVPAAVRTAQLQLRSTLPRDPTWAAFSVFHGPSTKRSEIGR